MPDNSITSRLKSAWNAFFNKDPTNMQTQDVGSAYTYRPDRTRFSRGNERSIVTAVYNKIAMDAASMRIKHVRQDENERFLEVIYSGLNNCLEIEANLDQTGRAFRQDMVASLLDEGCIAVVPVTTSEDPRKTGSYDIEEMRVGRVVQWYPHHVRVSVYNEDIGRRQEILMPKRSVSIIENPLYAVMNEPSSTMQRLCRKLSLLDMVDESNSSGKLDLIIQLPYVRPTLDEPRLINVEKTLKIS